MSKFRVHEKVTHESHDAILGRVAVKFDAGEHKPKNEAEEAALRQLVELGVAEEIPDSKKKGS